MIIILILRFVILIGTLIYEIYLIIVKDNLKKMYVSI